MTAKVVKLNVLQVQSKPTPASVKFADAADSAETKFDKKKAKCYYCKKIGHLKSECPVLAAKEAARPLNE